MHKFKSIYFGLNGHSFFKNERYMLFRVSLKIHFNWQKKRRSTKENMQR